MTETQRAIVRALGDTLFPKVADDDVGGGEVLPDRVSEFVERLPAEGRSQLLLALRLFDLGAVPLRARRFHKLRPAAREKYVRGASTSRLAVRRVIFRALRDTLALVYYQDERTWPFIGYSGPPVERRER